MLSRRTLSEGRAPSFDVVHRVRGRWPYPRPGLAQAPVLDPSGMGKGVTLAGRRARCVGRADLAEIGVESTE